jgi:hypothetical protein
MWQNGNPASAVTYYNNGTANPYARWGNDTGYGQSGYNFDSVPTQPVDVVLPPNPSDPFILGTFTHVNQPITGTSITDIQLKVSMDVSVNGTAVGEKSFYFDFLHDETTNGNWGDPCPDGGTVGYGVDVNGCADLVQFKYNALSDVFKIGNDEYTLALKGFVAYEQTVTKFWTIERRNNQADLTGYVALRSEVVPEPTTLVLLGSGLLGIIALFKRSQG